MSAFMIGTETMDKVVSTLCAKTQYGYVIGQFGDDFTDAKDAPTTIGRKLFAMNYEALRQLYGDERNVWDGQNYKATVKPPTKLADWVAGFKAIECLGYQCDEGNVPETDLFKALEAAEGKIATKIVSMLPEYERAPWG